jgi:hypothetical protein
LFFDSKSRIYCFNFAIFSMFSLSVFCSSVFFWAIADYPNLLNAFNCACSWCYLHTLRATRCELTRLVTRTSL